MSSVAKTRSEPVIYSLTRHYSVSWARQLATMSPLKHSLPQGVHGKLYVSTQRIMPCSLLINPRRQPPFLWIQITTYPLTVWDNSEKLYKDRTSQLRPHHFRLCFDLIRGWKTSGDFLSALLFLFSRFSRVSDVLCYALLLKTRAIIIVPILTFHRWYNSTVLWRHVAFHVISWQRPSNNCPEEMPKVITKHFWLQGARTTSLFSCNVVQQCMQWGSFLFPFWQCKFLLCVSFYSTVGWGSFVVSGVATWTHVQSIPPAADSRGFCEPDSRETWKQQHWNEV